MSSRRADASRRVKSWQRSYIPRVPGEDFGYLQKKSLGITDTKCVKCNGATKPKKKILGKKD
jgi:hypothetical protein